MHKLSHFLECAFHAETRRRVSTKAVIWRLSLTANHFPPQWPSAAPLMFQQAFPLLLTLYFHVKSHSFIETIKAKIIWSLKLHSVFMDYPRNQTTLNTHTAHGQWSNAQEGAQLLLCHKTVSCSQCFPLVETNDCSVLHWMQFCNVTS